MGKLKLCPGRPPNCLKRKNVGHIRPQYDQNRNNYIRPSFADDIRRAENTSAMATDIQTESQKDETTTNETSHIETVTKDNQEYFEENKDLSNMSGKTAVLPKMLESGSY